MLRICNLIRLTQATMLTLATSAITTAAAGQTAPVPSSVEQNAAAEDALGIDRWHVPKLQQSSRRHEDVSLTRDGRRIAGFVVYPDRPAPASVVVMIAEDQGLNVWAREMADEIAAMGYIVVAPDFMYGLGPDGGGGTSFKDYRSVFQASHDRSKDEAPLTAELNAWADYGLKLPQANGKLAVVGFAWGGGRAFRFATQRRDLAAAFIFYDVAPPATALAGLTAPVYGFYAAIDPRVTRSLEDTKAAMAAAGKRYEQVVYPGSDHMFVRLGDEPGNRNPANILARHRSLARLQELLAAM